MPANLISYLRLFRLPNIFTAFADVMMGFLFAGVATRTAWALLVALMVVSGLMYTAGMVLNDLFDIEQDRRERPDRPLPSGSISLNRARWLGWSFLGTGVGLAVACDWVWAGGQRASGALSVVALALAVCIVMYDRVLKKTLLGPWTMGSCRTANVLLGMAGGSMTVPLQSQWWNVDPAGVVVALGLGLYVSGVTWFARSEAVKSHRAMLAWGLFVMILGFGLLGIFPYFGEFGAGARQLTLDGPMVWPALLAVLVATIVRRAVFTILQPTPRAVQLTVKQCIVSIIMLDAAVCLATREPVWWAMGIVALMFPMLLLGRWIYST